jgi:6-phosphogluconolactonase (cycloisomerase 2 family)
MRTRKQFTVGLCLRLVPVVLVLASLGPVLTGATAIDAAPGAASGAPDGLAFVEALFDDTALDGVQAVAVSPDGDHVYAVSSSDNAVVAFRRDGSSGALSTIEMQQDGVNGVDGLWVACSVAVSPDGDHVYATSIGDDAVAVFGRDRATGALTYVEAKKDGVGGVDGMGDARSVAISPDGDHVYVTGADDDAVAVFSRDRASGALTFVEMQQDGVGGVDGLSGAWAVTVSPDGEHVYVAGSYDKAVAVFSRDRTSGALTFVEMQQDGVGGVDGLDGVRSVAVSPDGDHVYAASIYDDAVAVFSRDRTTGALTFVEMHRDDNQGGDTDGLDNPNSLTVSPDGEHVYVASYFDRALAIFRRDTATGALTFVEMHQDASLGGDADGLTGALFTAASPDGDHVYVVGTSDDAIAVFGRERASSALTYVEMQQDGVNGVDGLWDTRSAAVSPDGHHVYAVSYFDRAMAVFGRNTSTGALTYVEMLQDGVNGVDGLAYPFSVAVSPDGRHVYVASNENTVAVFGRNTSTGALTFVEVKRDGVDGVDGLDGAHSVAVSPDGHHVYVASYQDDAVVAFGRNETTGALTFIEMKQDGVGGVDGLDNARAVAVSPDGDHVYVTGADDDAVAVFERDKITGALTFAGTIKDADPGVDGLDGAWGVAISPDGGYLYVTGYNESAVAVLHRDVASGALTFVTVLKDGVGGVDGLYGAQAVAISPDGGLVYVAAEAEDALAIFSRNKASGALTLAGVKRDGVGGVDGLDIVQGVAISPDGHHIYTASGGDNAVAVFRRGGRTDSLAFVRAHRKAYGLGWARSVAVSPDGHHVYIASYLDNAVTAFARNETTGALTYVEMQQDGVGGVDGLYQAHSVAVSPDGRHVYAAGFGDNAVVAFGRNETTGALSFIEMKQDGAGGVDGLYGAHSVAVNPAGDYVYVAGFNDNAVAVFHRDGVTGALTFIEMKQDGVGGVDGLAGARTVAVSPDGDHVYVSSSLDNAVAVFGQNRPSGTLTFVEMKQDGVGGVDGLSGAWGVAVSPDGKHVYATGASDDAVAVFHRDGATGALSFVEVKKDGVGGVDGLGGATSAAVSPDGDYVYVSGYDDRALVIMSRDEATGALSFRGAKRDGVGGIDGLNGAISVAVSPGSDHIYVAGQADDAVAVFERQFIVYLPLVLKS